MAGMTDAAVVLVREGPGVRLATVFRHFEDRRGEAPVHDLLTSAEVVPTPPRAPNYNAFAERFVLSIKSECLRRIIFFGDSSFRRAVSEFVEHYHVERSHQ